MKTFNLLISPIKKFHLPRRFSRCLLLLVASISLSGCLLTAPFWGQTFDSKTDPVKLQAWTLDDSTTIVFECSKAYHGGLYPPYGAATWTTVTTVSSLTGPMYDSLGTQAYSASKSVVIPNSCWHYDGSYDKYVTAIRARNSGSSSTFKVFNENGLACLAEEIGLAGSWVGWIGKDCTLTYSNSTQDIPYVRVLADS